MGTAKPDEVDLGREQKGVQQHGMGAAGASKPQCQGHRRAQGSHSWGLASLLGIDPSESRGSSVGVMLCFEPVSPSGPADLAKSQCQTVTACACSFICKLNGQPATS